MKNLIKTTVLTAILGVGAVMAMTTSASADVACNRNGECWNVSKHYDTYPPALGVQFYNNEWRDAHRSDKNYHWRDDRQDDRGYYSNGKWLNFEIR